MKRYFRELDEYQAGLEALQTEFGRGQNTILFGAKEEQLNNATALVDYLKKSAR